MPRKTLRRRTSRKTRRKPKKRTSMKVIAEPQVRGTSKFKPLVIRPIKWVCPRGELPEKILVKMRYDDAYINFAPAALTGSYVWRANSIFAPDTAGSIQPALHDAFLNLYDKYKVTGAKINITVKNRSADRTIYGLVAADRATTGSWTADIIQRSSNVSCVVNETGKEGDTATLRLWVPISSVVGSKYHDQNYAGTMGGNPTDIVWTYLAGASLPGSNNITAQISASIIYYVELFEPKYDRATD